MLMNKKQKIQGKKKSDRNKRMIRKLVMVLSFCIIVFTLFHFTTRMFLKGENKNSAVVSEEWDTVQDVLRMENYIDIIGMSGKELLTKVGICSRDDISKIVIRQNESRDNFYIPEIEDVEIKDMNNISYFYEQLSQLHIVDNAAVNDNMQKVDVVKERTIYIYLVDGSYQKIQFYPINYRMMECFSTDGVTIDRECFEKHSEEFNNWLIDICNIDLTADYSEEYKRYKILQAEIIKLQQFKKEEWYGGCDLKFDDNVLNIHVLLAEDNKANREKIIETLKDKAYVVFEKSKIKYTDYELMKSKISDAISKERNKYSYVIACGIAENGVVVYMKSEVTEEQKDSFLKEFSLDGEGIHIEVEEK